MSVNSQAEQEDDYEFYSPIGSKNETRTGKGFLVRAALLGQSYIIYLSVCGCCTWPGRSGLHG